VTRKTEELGWEDNIETSWDVRLRRQDWRVLCQKTKEKLFKKKGLGEEIDI
jgi:hypothetical protein